MPFWRGEPRHSFNGERTPANLRVGEPATFPRVRQTRASLCRGGRGIQVSQGQVWHTSLWWAFFDIRGGKAETGSRMNRDRFDRRGGFGGFRGGAIGAN